MPKTFKRQINIRPHNDDPTLYVVAVYEYSRADRLDGEPLEDEVCSKHSLADVVARKVKVYL
jgi:hypothetical protein